MSYTNTIFVDHLSFKTKKVVKQFFIFFFLFERFHGDYCCHCQSVNQCFRNKEQKLYSSSRQKIFMPVFFSPKLPHIHKDGLTPLYSHNVSGEAHSEHCRGSSYPNSTRPIHKRNNRSLRQQDKNKTMPTCVYRICIFQPIVLRCSVG